MTEPNIDRWTSRDLPVLRWIVAQFDSGDPDVTETTIADALDISVGDAVAAVRNLERGGYVTQLIWMLSGDFSVGDVTERALRTAGIWPSGEGVDALVDALRQAEDRTADPEEKTLIRRAAGAVTSVSRDVMVDVLATVVTRQSGIG